MQLEEPILQGPLSDDKPLAVALPVQAQAVAPKDPVIVGQPVARGHWKTGVCGCCEDCSTCCAVTWCYPCIPLGQLWERVKGPNGICLKIALLLAALVMGIVLLQSIGVVKGMEAAYDYGYWYGKTHPGSVINGRLTPSAAAEVQAGATENYRARSGQYLDIAQFLSVIVFIIVIILLIKLRAHIRQRDQIAETQCNGCEDCCCAFWCAPFLTCQLLRHEGLTGTNYKLCNAKGGKDAAVPPVVVNVDTV